MASLPPTLGPFEPLYRLGAGGMAETFVAVRRGPGGFEQRVCIKRILPAYEDDQDFVRSFVDEARTSAALRHANIVQVLDFAQLAEDNSHYLVLELVDGLDLRALMQRGGHFDADLVALIASELASALEHAHEPLPGRGAVVHRDLSPSNVLISQAGEVKLTDFGIARVLGGQHRTASGVIKGKVPYMPPEYVSAGRFDARGDLFALGVLLFELAHGERPFDGESEIETLRKIVAGERLAFTAPAPRALVSCVERLLAAHPEARFESARELLDALPSVPVNQTRRRLAELVRTRVSGLPQLAGAPAAIVARGPRTLPLAKVTDVVSSGGPSPAPQWRSLLPSRAALFSLVAAISLLLAVTVAALIRVQLRRAAASAAVPPSLPIVPATWVAPAPLEPPTPWPSAEPEETGRPERGAEVSATEVSAVEVSASGRAQKPARALEPTASAELRVVVYPYGEVWVDDKYIGQSPLTLKVAPGTHAIAVGEGRIRERRSVQVSAGQHQSVVFRMPPADAR